jgi:hypothetical protein
LRCSFQSDSLIFETFPGIEAEMAAIGRILWICTVGLASVTAQVPGKLEATSVAPGIASAVQPMLFHLHRDTNYFVTGGVTPPQLVAVKAGSPPVLLQTFGPVSLAAAGGRYLFVQTTADSLGRLIDLEAPAAAQRTIALPGIATSAATSGDRVAVLTSGMFRATLSVYRCADGVKEGSVDLDVPSNTFLSFSNPERLLVVDALAARVMPVTFAGGLRAGSPMEIKGDRVEEARKKASSPNSRQIASGINSVIVMAHSTTQSGEDLYFLARFPVKEGARVIAANERGETTAAYHLAPGQFAPAMGGVSVARRSQLVAAGDRLMILDLDGAIRSYVRP